MLKFCLPLCSINAVEMFNRTCADVKAQVGAKSAETIIEFACGAAQYLAKPRARLTAFANVVDTVMAYVKDAKAADPEAWGFDVNFNVDTLKINRGNCVNNGIVAYISQDHGELTDWRK